MQQRLGQVTFAQPGNGDFLILHQNHPTIVTAADMGEVDEVASVAFKKSSVNLPLQIFHLAIIIGDAAIDQIGRASCRERVFTGV